MPRVSVVITSYNRAQFLPECLESVLSQTFRDFEVLVIDDGSTDNTPDLMRSYGPPVRYIRQMNQGVVAAYNKGIELASGEYVAFLDSDDAFMPYALQMGVEIFDKHPEVGLSHGQAYLVDNEGNMIGLKIPYRSKGSFVRSGKEEIKSLIMGNYITGSTTMVRRRCFGVVGLFDNTFCYGSEDFEMWIRLTKKHDVAYIDKPLAKYRVHAQSISARRNPEEVQWTHTLILESVFNDTELGETYRPLRAKAYYHLYLRLADMAISKWDRKKSRSYIIKVFRMYPQVLLGAGALELLHMLARTMLPTRFIDFQHRVKTHLAEMALGNRNSIRTLDPKVNQR